MQKNQAFSSFCSGDKINSKILLSDWLKPFWPISHDSKYGINFFRDQIQKKCMTRFSNKFKKPYF